MKIKLVNFMFSEHDPCRSNPCAVGGACENKPDGFECKCTEDYYGALCAGKCKKLNRLLLFKQINTIA